MKKCLQVLIPVLFFGQFANAQADLIVVGNVIINSPNPVHVGITINGTFSVQNVGSSTAGASRTAIYLAPDPNNPLTGVLISEISLESLAAGASSSNIQFNFPIPYTIGNTATYYVIVKLNDNGAITESNYSNNMANAPISVDPSPWAAQNMPYPIIFIHGLIGAETVWDELINSLQNSYGWSYGGNMNFCLNYDGNLNTSNKNNDYHDFTDISSLHTDDFYTVNFDVDIFGTPHGIDYKSNQSAIVKQGLAIRDAIMHVLDITGRDKVILVSHSMGGLSAREYLQNPSIWQEPNVNHHVAKLVTIGTPHGGSNATDFGTGVSGVDLSSEAVRDLRKSYLISAQQGTYLFNGAEDNDYMKDLPGTNFHNVNVNCNEIPSGEWITGINNKPILTNLSYSCAIGSCNVLWGISSDGVVGIYEANINNYRSVNADTFILKQPLSDLNPIWHTKLTKQFAGNMRAMDEPNNSIHAYKVSSGQLYYGNITYQSSDNQLKDFDYYKIIIPSNGNLNIQVYNITTPLFLIELKNSSNISVYSVSSNGKSYINTNNTVTAGIYYISLSGTPFANSYLYPYSFKYTFSATTTYCSGTTNLTVTSGTFSDGSGASNYNNNTDCKWKIQPSGATSITLSFSAFDVINSGDTVYVYDGATTSFPLLLVWTGNALPSAVTSTGGVMLVRFSSDASNTAAGWTANYTSITVPTYCNGSTTLTSVTGTFSDGSGTNNYGNNSHCSWLINPPGAFNITLSFTTFNTEAVYDVVNVYDGNDETAPFLGSFSGNSIPASLSSSGGAIFVDFITNNTITAPGWNASYTSYIQNGTGIVEYEYWFDANYANAVSTPVMPQNVFHLNSNISTTNLTAGLHTFNIRFKNIDNHWGSAVSNFFYKPLQLISPPAQYEYWFDNDYSNMSLTNISNSNNFILSDNLNANNLNNGLHTFNIRFKPDGKLWSSVASSFFYKIPVPVTGTPKYQYWFDNNSQDSVTVVVGSTNNLILLDSLINAQPVGLHTINLRFYPDGGLWSSVVSSFFYKNPTTSIINNTIARCVYWYDNNWQDPRVVYYGGQQDLSSIINTDTEELSIGMHRVSMMFKDDKGSWSSVISDSFNRVAISSPVCPINNKQFISRVFLSNSAVRQWQVDEGTGFVNLANNANYSGVNSDTLQIISAPTSWYGYKYRCVLTDGSSTVTSEVFTLKFYMVWYGITNNAWENPANWNCNILPDANTDVIIYPGVTRFPEINTSGTCRSLTAKPGVNVTVKTGASFIITH